MGYLSFPGVSPSVPCSNDTTLLQQLSSFIDLAKNDLRDQELKNDNFRCCSIHIKDRLCDISMKVPVQNNNIELEVLLLRSGCFLKNKARPCSKK